VRHPATLFPYTTRFRSKAQVQGRPVGLMLGLQGSVHPFVTRPSYQAIAHLPLAERVAVMRDPAFRAKLIAEAPEAGHPFVNSLRSEEHTSELQSRENLV